MNFVLYLIALILFVLAAFLGGVHSTYGDLVALGLAFFAAGHLVPSGWWPRPPQ